MLGVNLMGAWALTKAAAPGMRFRGWGRIITVTTSFFTMLRAQMHPYGPVKAALEAMTAGHAAEFKGSGVTVNVVVPGGPTDTPMVTTADYPDRSQLIRPVAMARPGRFLCSPAADEVPPPPPPLYRAVSGSRRSRTGAVRRAPPRTGTAHVWGRRGGR
jgi:NAD(P)-dependent dehydrogenase (short-subunit alcohol dehydrogenase family)